MSNDLHIKSTGCNRLSGDDEKTRTVEIEVGNYHPDPFERVRFKASFKVILRNDNGGDPYLDIIDAQGHQLFIELKGY